MGADKKTLALTQLRLAVGNLRKSVDWDKNTEEWAIADLLDVIESNLSFRGVRDLPAELAKLQARLAS